MKANLETLIRDYSEMMASHMLEAARWAKSEEDIRHDCNKLIDDFLVKAKMKVRGRHEYGLAGGHIDSKYGGVIIEYKAPKGAGKLTENPKSAGVKAVVKQIEQRFKDFHEQENVRLEQIFAVGCDGDTFVFVRHRGKTLEVENPQPVTQHTVERLLRALVSLGAQGFSFTPDKLCEHFGGEGKIALDGIGRIYEVISETKSPKARVFFKQWQILFGEVCGYDVHGQSPRIKKLGEHYNIPDAKPAELLFSVHTYYGILIKLLAAEIVSSFSPLGASTLKKLNSAPTSAKLRLELETLEQGGIWSQIGIRNFLEGDLFSWYLDAWDERLEEAVRSMVTTLNKYDPATLSVEPAESRDLLKKLYQHLFPRSVRHDLGEYYTPDWLAELTLNELGYDGNPDKRVLDPACGSGTFLVMTINRIRAWYSDHRHDCGFGEDELLKKILNNVIGFDLNPLAVMASRTNYLLALRGLLRHGGEIELPIYLCDSIMTPSEYGDLFAGNLGTTKELKTSVGSFFIPTEVATKREHIGKYANSLESCIRDQYNADDFIVHCQTEGLPIKEEKLHKALYRRLQQLDGDNQNGIWARIIKNAFAPLFIGAVDYVAGNPPWINWENLPEDYRDSMKGLWKEYGLFTLSGSAARLGGGKKDLSMLFVYTAVDNYLKENGRLGFVITQSVFKTQGAGDGFRRFRFSRGDTTWHLRPLVVHDLSKIQVFEGATNRTAIFGCVKTRRPFKYPVKYVVWTGPSRISQEDSLASVFAATKQTRMKAVPIVTEMESSPWLTAPSGALPGLRKAIGQSHHRAYEGVNTGGLNGCFWIRVVEKLPNGNLVMENLYDVGKIKVPHVEAVIEPDLVYPLLRGRDVTRWNAEPSCHVILAQDPNTRKGIPETKMKRALPKTFAYLKKFEGNLKNPKRGTLRGRSSSSVRRLMEKGAFYSMFAVGPYTMAKWKVLWPEVGHTVRAGVIGPREVDSSKPALPDHSVVAVSCSTEAESHFLCALLNASPVTLAVQGYIVLHPSPHVLENIAIPRFNPNLAIHKKLATLSKNCHKFAPSDSEGRLPKLERIIDELAAEIWSITPAELKAIRKALDRD